MSDTTTLPPGGPGTPDGPDRSGVPAGPGVPDGTGGLTGTDDCGESNPGGVRDLDARGVLDLVVEQRRSADAAEAGLLAGVVHLVDLFPVLDPEGEDAAHLAVNDRPLTALEAGPAYRVPIAGAGCPEVREEGVVALAAALGVPYRRALSLVGETLELCYRLPRLWALVQEGRLPAWQARRVARETSLLSAAAVEFVDRHLAVGVTMGGVRGQIPGNLTPVITLALNRCDPEVAEGREEAALAGRHVSFEYSTSTDSGATADMTARLDILDALDLDHQVTEIATAMGRLGDSSPVGVRRAHALGMLANPQHTLNIFGDTHGDTDTGTNIDGGDNQNGTVTGTGTDADGERAADTDDIDADGDADAGTDPAAGAGAGAESGTDADAHADSDGEADGDSSATAPTGSAGAAGSTGSAGPTAPTGPAGPAGFVGPTGPAGPAGFVGLAGSVGLVEAAVRGGIGGRLNATGATLYVHVTAADLATAMGADPDTNPGDWPGGGAVVEKLNAVTLGLLREWVGRTDSVTIRPVLDMSRTDAVDQHDPPGWMREAVILRDRHCVFPGCGIDARACDQDHVIPYRPMESGGPPGQTSLSNLACLCRRHHRMKTRRIWRYQRLPDHGYEWTSPHGHLYTTSPGRPRQPGQPSQPEQSDQSDQSDQSSPPGQQPETRPDPTDTDPPSASRYSAGEPSSRPPE